MHACGRVYMRVRARIQYVHAVSKFMRLYMCAYSRSTHACIAYMPEFLHALGARVRAYMNVFGTCTLSVYARTSHTSAVSACIRVRVHMNAIEACTDVLGASVVL